MAVTPMESLKPLHWANGEYFFCLLHVDVHQLRIDDSDSVIVDHESSCNVLNVALWITPANSIGHKFTIFIRGSKRDIRD